MSRRGMSRGLDRKWRSGGGEKDVSRLTTLAMLALITVLAGAVAVTGCGSKDAGGASSNGASAAPGGAGSAGGSGGAPAPSGGRPGGSGGPGGRSGPREVPVQVARAELGKIARALTVSGVVEPIRSVGVNSQMSGALLFLEAEEGATVRKGQVLAKLDDRELRAQLTAAEAAFQVAESAHARAKQLRERQVITLPEYERDRTAYAAAEAELDQIKTRLGYATIAAPISGVVTEKRVESGDIVANQSRLFTIADLSTKVVLVQVSELDVVNLHEGNQVDVALDAFPGRELRGRIRRIFPSADPTTRLVPVEVALEGESADLARPGFLARVTFALGEREHVLLVPASAVVNGTTSQAVYVVEEGKAHRRDVRTGLISRGQVEIEQGLGEGDVVVTVGNNTLQDGAAVRVLTTDAEGR